MRGFLVLVSVVTVVVVVVMFGGREEDVVVVAVVVVMVGREGLGAVAKEGAPELEVLDCGGVRGSVWRLLGWWW